VIDALTAVPGLTLPEPEGAFYAFPHIAGLTDSAAFTATLVRQAGVALAPGAAFGPDGEGYVRLCFAASESILAEALVRFRDFLKAL
jgi:aspartate/methionine/tyrosine aminotransferase